MLNESNTTINKTMESIGSHMKTNITRKGGGCIRYLLLFYSILFWLTSLGILTVGLLVVLDPKRSYILDLVDFSENFPLLRASAYTAIGTGFFSFLLGFVGCCGALNRMRCLLIGFICGLVAIFIAQIASGTLAVFYRSSFSEIRMETYLSNMTKEKYGRDKWVKPLVDNIQFFNKCCGGKSPSDYENSFWFITNNDRGTRSYVPSSCCRQSLTARHYNIKPIDSLCSIYYYNHPAFNASVNNQSCAKPVLNKLHEQSNLLIIMSFVAAGVTMVGILCSLILIDKVVYYTYLEER